MGLLECFKLRKFDEGLQGSGEFLIIILLDRRVFEKKIFGP